MKNSAELLQVLEQWGSLRDRPFHPIAKAKTGLKEQDYQNVMAEFNCDITLNWVAVNKSSLLCGDKISKLDQLTPAQFILSKQQQHVLQQEMQHQGIASSHIALPVHPWQLQNALPLYLPVHFRQTPVKY